MNLQKIATQFIIIFSICTYSTRTEDAAYVPNYKFRPGKEIVAVYVGSSYCGPCKSPEFKKDLMQMLVRTSHEVRESEANFWALGISVDSDIKVGYEFLKMAVPFDEISVGRSWENSAALRYVLTDEFGGPMVPQVILIEREVGKDASGLKIQNEKVLLRLIGPEELKKWLSRNIPLSEVKTFKGIIIE